MSPILMTLGILVGVGHGRGRCRQANPLVGSVVDGVESLEEGLAEDKVQSRCHVATNVPENQIHFSGATANLGVKATRPDLSIRSNFERNLGEKERAGVLSINSAVNE